MRLPGDEDEAHPGKRQRSSGDGNLADVVCECLHLNCPEPDLYDWTEMVDYLKHPETEITVALVGKYTQLHDAYISVVEALKHGGIFNRATVDIRWIDSETITADNIDELMADVSGILVPGGFGHPSRHPHYA